MKKSKYKIEIVEWIDSFGCTSTWSEIKPISTILICQTVGFVISENEDVISIANSVAEETDNTVEQANGIMTIPKACIKHRKTVK
jgi:hypothetical protein